MKSQRHRLVGTLGRIGLLLAVLLGLLAPGAPAAPAALAAEGPGNVGDLPFPPWWDGECDTNYYRQQTGRDAFSLGGSYRGVQACGPRPAWDAGAQNVVVRFFPGAWGQYEWQCVELVMRYLYLAFDIRPYSANGKDVVANYSGDRLVKITNGTPGQAPEPGDVISYDYGDESGHTAIVVESQVDESGNGTIRTLNQNMKPTTAETAQGYATLRVANWVVADGATGWLHDPQGDQTPPVITPAISGPAGANGWRTGPTTIGWGVEDPESGIAEASGCETVTIAADTAGTTLTCRATNGAGIGAEHSVTVKLDATPPALAIDAADPGPGLQLFASDALAGLASREVSLDGGATWLPSAEPLPAAKALLLRATDNAGNQALMAAQLRQPADSADWWERRISGARYRDVPGNAWSVIGVRGAALVSVVGGRAYTFGAAVITSDPTTQASITVFWLDAQGRLLERDDTASPIGATGRFERTVRAPVGAAFAQIDLRGHGVGQIWIDDLTLAGADGLNLLPSGAFNAEDAAAWRTLRYLDRLGTAELRDHPAAGPALALTLRPTWTSPESRLIASQNPRGRAGGELRQGAAFAVRSGVAYELALAIQGVEVTGRATLELRFYDAQGNLIGTEVTGAPQGSFGWQWLRVAVEAPAGAASARAALTLEGEGRLWLDTLTLIGH